jgi:hypothetical protein
VVLVEHAQSGWLLWRHPALRPTIDLRTEIYSGTDIEAYHQTMRVRPGWQAALASTGARYALLEADSSLADALAHEPGWALERRAGDFALFRAS